MNRQATDEKVVLSFFFFSSKCVHANDVLHKPVLMFQRRSRIARCLPLLVYSNLVLVE
jgi:hypothetical protein